MFVTVVEQQQLHGDDNLWIYQMILVQSTHPNSVLVNVLNRHSEKTESGMFDPPQVGCMHLENVRVFIIL